MTEHLKRGLVCLVCLLLCVSLFCCTKDGPARPAETTAAQTEVPGTPPVTDPSRTEAPETEPPVTAPAETEPPQTEPPVPPVTFTDITFLSAGDIMFHNKQVLSALDKETGEYSFADVFQYLAPVVEKADFAVANLESALAGTDYPYTQANTISFNAPDTAADAIKAAGFDLLLFANNHTNDCRLPGMKRTVSVLREKGIEAIGARDDTADPFNKVVDVKGVKLGMLNYTNDGSWGTEATNTLNGNTLRDGADRYVNVFYLGKIDAFYADVEKEIARLKDEGADLIVFYIHWGREYVTEPDAWQKKIAQKLCDLGVDILIGSHPHVIQPAAMLTSERDPAHTMFCLYSTGNFVSNQNRSTLSESYCKGHNVNTENGLMLTLTVRKYSTGETLLIGAETDPTWVQRFKTPDGDYDYRIIPLREAVKDPEAYGLNRSSNYTSGKTKDTQLAQEALAMTDEMLQGAVEAFNRSVVLPQLG